MHLQYTAQLLGAYYASIMPNLAIMPKNASIINLHVPTRNNPQTGILQNGIFV